MANKKSILKVLFEDVPLKISELKGWEHNPRMMTEKDKSDLKASLETFGYVTPIVVNKDNTIIGGHQRVDGITSLYGKETEVIVKRAIKKLSEKQLTELNLRLNKNVGQWDFDKLNSDAFDIDTLLKSGFEPFELGTHNPLLDKPNVSDDREVDPNDSMVNSAPVDRVLFEMDIRVEYKDKLYSLIKKTQKERGLEYIGDAFECLIDKLIEKNEQ